jgi:hypothetical protein
MDLPRSYDTTDLWRTVHDAQQRWSCQGEYTVILERSTERTLAPDLRLPLLHLRKLFKLLLAFIASDLQASPRLPRKRERGSYGPMLAAQCKMARAALGLSARDLAAMAGESYGDVILRMAVSG